MSTTAERNTNKAQIKYELAQVDGYVTAEVDRRWKEMSDRDISCFVAHGGRSRRSLHPCERPFGHPDDRMGHVCRCDAEKFLEEHAPCSAVQR